MCRERPDPYQSDGGLPGPRISVYTPPKVGQNRRPDKLHHDRNCTITRRTKGKSQVAARMVPDLMSNSRTAVWNEEGGFAHAGWYLIEKPGVEIETAWVSV